MAEILTGREYFDLMIQAINEEKRGPTKADRLNLGKRVYWLARETLYYSARDGTNQQISEELKGIAVTNPGFAYELFQRFTTTQFMPSSRIREILDLPARGPVFPKPETR